MGKTEGRVWEDKNTLKNSQQSLNLNHRNGLPAPPPLSWAPSVCLLCTRQMQIKARGARCPHVPSAQGL